jgi:hypothetical protein
MKKALLILLIILFAGWGVYSQSLTVTKGGNNVANGDTLTVSGDVWTLLQLTANVTNNAADTLSIKCKKIHTSVILGADVSICWGGSCWDSSHYVSDDPTIINAGQTATEFSGHYKAMGHAGVSIVRYKFYDENNVTDSISFFGKFIGTSGVGINESNMLTTGEIYPNPADNTAYLNYSISTEFSNGEIRVIDLLGNKIQIIPFYEKNGRIKINTENLNSGIYFYSMTLDGKMMFTKKLIIRHK